MCGGGGGGGGGGVSNNRPVSRPPPVSIENPPSMNTPKNPPVSLSEDSFDGRGRTPKRAKPPERSLIDKVADRVRELVPEVGNFIKDKIGRGPAEPEQRNPAPVIPR